MSGGCFIGKHGGVGSGVRRVHVVHVRIGRLRARRSACALKIRSWPPLPPASQNSGHFSASFAIDPAHRHARWSSEPTQSAPQWLRLDFGQRRIRFVAQHQLGNRVQPELRDSSLRRWNQLGGAAPGNERQGRRSDGVAARFHGALRPHLRARAQRLRQRVDHRRDAAFGDNSAACGGNAEHVRPIDAPHAYARTSHVDQFLVPSPQLPSTASTARAGRAPGRTTRVWPSTWAPPRASIRCASRGRPLMPPNMRSKRHRR